MKKIKENKKNWKLYQDKKTGNWLDYVEYNEEKHTEMENFIFEATIIPAGCYRGRSAAGFTFLDSDNGSEFTMRIAKSEEFFKALSKGKVEIVSKASIRKKEWNDKFITYTGGFKAKFTFFKQGANYSIGLVEEDDSE